MKRTHNKITFTFMIAIFLMVGSKVSNAQNGEFGLRFMPTFTALSLNTSTGGTVEGSATMGYGVGAFLAFNFNPHIGVQAEGIYSSISQKYKEEEIERKINLKYINIPLLLSLNTNKNLPVNLNLVGGPQMGISVGSSMSSSGGDGTTATQGIFAVRKGDVGFAFGAGLDFGVNPDQTIRISFGYRGVRGLFDISDNNRTDVTNSYYILDRTKIKTNAVYLGASIMF
ncbi:MAG: PorT family protein [Flavobacteriales bacterium]|nr:PorT family protein [Flavobacteriales bacterium]